MSPRARAALQLALACSALLGCAAVWSRATSVVAVAPVADGQPVTMSVVYHPPVLMLILLLMTAAGVLAVTGAAALWRTQQCANNTP